MTSVAVVGASGYIGSELLRILVNHPKIDKIIALSRSLAGKKVSSYLTHLRGFLDVEFINTDLEKLDADFVYVAAPPGEWINSIPAVLDKGIRVVSMGGKFRIKDPLIDSKIYPGFDNTRLMDEVVYGLPELYREQISKARFIANPGCYTTSIILALAPLSSQSKILDLDKIVVSSVSGSSGAGAGPSRFLHHPEMSSNLRPYKVLEHRHTPEMEHILGREYKTNLNISFTPSVGNYSRGILSYVNLFTSHEFDLAQAFTEYHGGEFFIRFIGSDEKTTPNIKDVVNTNFCDLGAYYDGTRKRIFILSATDNLIKGGSGTAVQNMNLMLGFDESLGLESVGLSP
ncbi:MAG: N-acetyl-gamma-glutamyl-phosphate reductase [Candidatus Altiarchaeales archaeon ex4484_96]|nr:MAG: N-acetyl-gamma-glutamyl-phosphate reductase [Candidatus Altiarchaeales archaeon ex4484_96]